MAKSKAPLHKVIIEIECESCYGSGIHRISYYPAKVGVTCRKCEGNGFIFFSYIPFTGLKTRTDVTKVFRNNPMASGANPFVSAQQFHAGKRP